MNYALLSEIINQPLGLDANYAYAYYKMLEANHPAGADFSAARQALLPFIAADQKSLVASSDRKGFAHAEKGSIAVIQLQGPVVKNSQFCGPRGTVDIANDFYDAKANPNIIGAVFLMETGGGMSLAVEPLTKAMQSFQEEKPIVGLYGSYLCSAGYYIGAYCDELYADHKRSTVGSIGTMVSFADLKPKLEKEGIVFHEIYATQSTKKNQVSRDLDAGKYDDFRVTHIDPTNEDFIADVKEQRAGKLDLSNKDILAGEIFQSFSAESLGMIDGVLDFSQAVARVRELANSGGSPKNLEKSKSNNTMKLENVTALSGVENPTDEQIADANGDLRTNNISSVILVESSFLDAAAQATTDLESLRATHEATVASLAAANETIATNTATLDANATEIATLKTSLSRRGASTAPVISTEGDNNDGLTEEQKLDNEIHALPHYAGVLDNPLFAKN